MKLKTLLTLAVASLCSVHGAWAERVAPTSPEPQTLESGNTYYLYNVGSQKYLSESPNAKKKKRGCAYFDTPSCLKWVVTFTACPLGKLTRIAKPTKGLTLQSVYIFFNIIKLFCHFLCGYCRNCYLCT